MKFSYSAIGDNTQENREWLEKLGYVRQKDTPIDGDVLLTYVDDTDTWVYETASYLSDYVDTDRGSVINCLGNPQLFKAVSAMREDSDFGQWFTDGKYWFENNKCANRYNKKHMPNYRKATLTELQERFKEKEA